MTSSFILFLAIGYLLIFNIYCIIHNVTTIEDNYKLMKTNVQINIIII